MRKAKSQFEELGLDLVALLDPKEFSLMLASTRLTDGLAQRAEQDLGFALSGMRFTARDAAQIADQETWAKHLANSRFPVRGLDRDEVMDMV